MKIKKLLLCVMLIIAAFVAVACSEKPISGENLLTNGDFSDGLSGWTTYKADSGATNFTVGSYEETDGSHTSYASIDTDDYNKAILGNRVRVERGETYEISVWIRVERSFAAQQYGGGAYLSVAELPDQTTCISGYSFSNLSPLISSSSGLISQDWTKFRLIVTIDNVDYITVELRTGANDNLAYGKANFRDVSISKLSADTLSANSNYERVAHIISKEEDISAWAFMAAVFFGLAFIAAAIFAYEFIAKEIKKTDKESKKKKKEAKAAEAEAVTAAKEEMVTAEIEAVSNEDEREKATIVPAEAETQPVKEAAPQKTKKKLSKEFAILLIALGVIFVAKIIFAGLVYGHDIEFKAFSDFARSLGKDGLTSFNENNPQNGLAPGYVYYLSFIGLFTKNMRHGEFMELVLLRLPSIIADISAAILIFFILKRALKNQRAALAGALLYAVNIAVFANSVWWGQFDSVLSALILLSLYMALTKNYLPACFVYAAAVLFKVQALFIAPIFAAYLVVAFLKNHDKRLTIALGAGFAFLAWFILTLPLTANQMRGGEFFYIFKHYGDGLRVNKLTLNAFNFFGVFGLNDKTIENTALANWLSGVMITLLAALLIVLFVRYKGKGNIILLISGYLVAAICTFSVNMREHYIFPAIALLLVASLLIRDRRLYFVSVLYTVLEFLASAGLLLSHTTVFAGNSALMIIGSIASIGVFVYLTLIMIDVLLQNKIKPIKNYTNIFK